MKPIAIVTPWFGKDLKGGAEQQAWEVATRLALQGHIIEVLTTCCRSFHDDWAVNYFKAGLDQEQKFKIRRFSVNCRDQHSFDRVNSIMLNLPSSKLRLGVNPVTLEEAAIFSSANINSNDLLSYLKTKQEKYSAFIFLPYLYGPILNGLPIVANKAFLQPCLHNEVYAYLPEVANIFHGAKGLLFISDGEAQLAKQLYGPGITLKSIVVGAGVEVTQGRNQAINQIKDLKVTQERFVLYLGRRDVGKNTNLLVQSYVFFKQKFPDANLKLVLAGPGNISFDNSVQGVVDLNLVKEDEKELLLANCLALFQPSRNESYSRVMMEAWLYGRPVAAHRDCLATAIAVQRAKGGWLAGTETEWQEMFSLIDCIGEDELANYGSNGQKYAQENASWDKIIKRYEAGLGLSKEEMKVLPELQSRNLKEIHQLLPNLAYGDAISNHALFIRDYLRSCGYKSDIFVRYLDQRVQEEAKVFQPTSISKQAGLIYHHSIGSEITAYAVGHPDSKCLIYHNITPAEFFQPYRPEFAKILEKGRSELKQLAPHFTISVGDSAYNAADLAASGFAEPGVLPIAVDPQKWDIPADAALMAKLQDGKSNLLFVGRLAPNKCQDDLVEAFAHYLTLDQQARLILAGNGEPSDPYYCHLINTIERLNLTQHVLLTGQVDDTQLLALYRTAHLFWSMSEHEGFCVPLVEAMWFDIPILAYKSSAVPETLGEAGILFTSKNDLSQVAALAKLLVKDRLLRSKVTFAQRRRRESFTKPVVNASLNELVSRIENSGDFVENFQHTKIESPCDIDVRDLIKQLSVEELCQTAEEYFATITNWNYHLSKPFSSIDDMPELLTCFSQVLQGLRILPGMTALDFGAGSCWTSRYLTQLGFHVIALDVSASALKIGQELFVRQPIIGDKPSPQFLHFNGRKIDLPDNSVDRILCFDAFHHVPNPEHIIKEFSRILKQGGIAGFSEPGPNHSKSPQSQHEMRNFKVIENDIHIRDIWNYAQKVGFTNIDLAIFNAIPFRVCLKDFEEFFSGKYTKKYYVNTTHSSMSNRRIFFLYKGEPNSLDSRQRAELLTRLNIRLDKNIVPEGTLLLVHVTVTNIGSAIWLPTVAKVGAVHLGAHLLDQHGKQLNYDYFRHVLTPDENKSILPNETLNFEMQVPIPTKGCYILEFDLVSEGVCWFSVNGSKTSRVDIKVI